MSDHTNFKIEKPILLVGLMGAGKSVIGLKISQKLGLDFIDSDSEIEQVVGASISDIFSIYGEKAFRNYEKTVINRLLSEKIRVIATGGGAFMDSETRHSMKSKGTVIWIRADIETLVERTKRRDSRPLLRNNNHRKILQQLMIERSPIYAEADIFIDSDVDSIDSIAKKLIDKLKKELS